jgi:hypothetical protein
MRLRKLDEAETQLRSALTLQHELLGGQHPSCGETLLRLGQTLEYQRNVDEAEKLIRQSCDILSQSMGERHPSTFRAQANLARFLVRRKRFDEADSLYGNVVEEQRFYFGCDNSHVGTMLAEWGRTRLKRNDPVGAELLMRQAMQALTTDLDEDHPFVQRERFDLAGVLTLKACFTEAEILLLEAHASAARIELSSPGAMKTALEQLIKLYDSWCQAQPGGPPCASVDEWQGILDQNP